MRSVAGALACIEQALADRAMSASSEWLGGRRRGVVARLAASEEGTVSFGASPPSGAQRSVQRDSSRDPPPMVIEAIFPPDTFPPEQHAHTLWQQADPLTYEAARRTMLARLFAHADYRVADGLSEVFETAQVEAAVRRAVGEEPLDALDRTVLSDPSWTVTHVFRASAKPWH
jgi:hypothetical protein